MLYLLGAAAVGVLQAILSEALGFERYGSRDIALFMTMIIIYIAVASKK